MSPAASESPGPAAAAAPVAATSATPAGSGEAARTTTSTTVTSTETTTTVDTNASAVLPGDDMPAAVTTRPQTLTLEPAGLTLAARAALRKGPTDTISDVPTFDDLPGRCGEKILEAIQQAWIDEVG